MFYQTESKLQAWRALAILADGRELLIYVGRSTTQVRGGYAGAFLELFGEEERALVQSIEMQCWHGAADRGYWVPKGTLNIPTAPAKEPKVGGNKILPFRKPALAASEPEPEETVLPFKRLATTA